MRSLLVLAACCSLALIPACTEKIIVKSAPPAETPVDEEPEPEPTDPPEPATDPLVIDLGEVRSGTDVTFEVPEGALGFNIVAEGKVSDFDPNQPFGIQRITDPKGNVIHDDFTPKGGTRPTSIAAFDVIASASVPQGEDAPTNLAGTWKVRFGAYGSAAKPKLKATVRVQSSGDGKFHGGQLDLHIHVPSGLKIGSRTVNAAKAESDPDLEERVETFFAVTSELLGIEKGKVVFHEEASSYRELDGVQDLLKGFAVSKGQQDGTPALHILMTNVIADQGQPIAAGIAPGIPGAANVFGRNVSGIIVTTSPSADNDVLTMIHEAGHFFGLNHTTEFDGESSDPLSDTPVCETISRDRLYECPDRTNIMFPAGAIDGPVSLSSTQKRVYRGSPIYRALPAGGTNRSLSAPLAPLSLKRTFRVSGSSVLSPVERELSSGFCGLSTLDANGLVQRYGRAQAIAQLKAAAADADLAPFIRGRANLALRALNAE